MSAEPILFSVPRRKGGGPDDEVEFEVPLEYITPDHSPDKDEKWELGPADINHAQGRHPSFVELLVSVPRRLDPALFAAGLRSVLSNFACAAGWRAAGGTAIVAGSGVRFSAIRVADDVLLAKPPAPCLFDRLRIRDGDGADVKSGSEVLTLRISVGQSGQSSIVGLCFDHALCDVAGAVLLLAHVSARYAGDPLPAAPHHDRMQQARFVEPTDGSEDVGSASAGGKAVRTMAGANSRQRTIRIKGGCVCVEWDYNAAALQELKVTYEAKSRHDAVFSDVLQLLHSAGHTPLATVSITRDERGRAGLPAEHFGNGAVQILATLPPLPASGSAVAAALRSAIESGTGVEKNGDSGQVLADAHLNTWWHGLQRPVSFGAGADLANFSRGPGTLATAANQCAKRGGQPNVTVLPSANGGLVLSMLAPLGLAHGVLKLLRSRAKEARVALRYATVYQSHRRKQKMAVQPFHSMPTARRACKNDSFNINALSSATSLYHRLSGGCGSTAWTTLVPVGIRSSGGLF